MSSFPPSVITSPGKSPQKSFNTSLFFSYRRPYHSCCFGSTRSTDLRRASSGEIHSVSFVRDFSNVSASSCPSPYVVRIWYPSLSMCRSSLCTVSKVSSPVPLPILWFPGRLWNRTATFFSLFSLWESLAYLTANPAIFSILSGMGSQIRLPIPSRSCSSLKA